VQKISADVIEVITSQEVQDRLLELGVIVVGSTPAALATHLAKEIARWSEVIKEAGIAP
jgi:tripartite-type tricarboxylate transporter receptor subunit TctC